MSEHGYGPYTRGCRCEVCREAKRQYVAARRAAGLEPTRAGEVSPPSMERQRAQPPLARRTEPGLPSARQARHDRLPPWMPLLGLHRRGLRSVARAKTSAAREVRLTQAMSGAALTDETPLTDYGRKCLT